MPFCKYWGPVLGTGSITGIEYFVQGMPAGHQGQGGKQGGNHSYPMNLTA